MRFERKTTFILLALCLLQVSTVAKAATVIEIEATDNATVLGSGPRTGGNGKNFFNIQGGDNATFASFGVADFTFAAPIEPLVSVDSIRLLLTQSNAGFSANLGLNFWLTEDLATGIQPGTPPPVFFDATALPDGVNNQFGPLYALGTGNYVVGTSGAVDDFSLTLTSPAEAYLLGQINSGGSARFLITPATGSGAATYAGFSNNTYAGPTLSISATAVPEPSTVAMLVSAGLGGVVRRKLRRRHREG